MHDNIWLELLKWS